MARFTNEDLAIKLAEISTKIDNLKEDIDEIKPLELRVNDLENFRSNMKGASVVGGAVLTILIGFVTMILDHILGK